ncbi:MAG: hypothetical protein ABUK01_19340 [Leptospirales bacterium]
MSKRIMRLLLAIFLITGFIAPNPMFEMSAKGKKNVDNTFGKNKKKNKKNKKNKKKKSKNDKELSEEQKIKKFVLSVYSAYYKKNCKAFLNNIGNPIYILGEGEFFNPNAFREDLCETLNEIVKDDSSLKDLQKLVTIKIFDYTEFDLVDYQDEYIDLYEEFFEESKKKFYPQKGDYFALIEPKPGVTSADLPKITPGWFFLYIRKNSCGKYHVAAIFN